MGVYWYVEVVEQIMGRVNSSRRTGDDRGSQLAEFAVVLTLLLLLLAGVWDLGGMFRSYITIANAARDGARYAIRLPCTASYTQRTQLRNAIMGAVTSEIGDSFTDDELANLTISINPDPVEDGCPSANGNPYVVTVTLPHEMGFTSITGLSDITLSASAHMNWFGNDTE